MISYKTRAQCQHPERERWQWRDTWQCCECGAYFWGAKTSLPQADIYGRPALGSMTAKGSDPEPIPGD